MDPAADGALTSVGGANRRAHTPLTPHTPTPASQPLPFQATQLVLNGMAGETEKRNVVSYAVVGSNDGISWSSPALVVVAKAGVEGNNLTSVVNLPGAAYTYFRVLVTGVQGGATAEQAGEVAIDEIGFRGEFVAGDVSPPPPPPCVVRGALKGGGEAQRGAAGAHTPAAPAAACTPHRSPSPSPSPQPPPSPSPSPPQSPPPPPPSPAPAPLFQQAPSAAVTWPPVGFNGSAAAVGAAGAPGTYVDATPYGGFTATSSAELPGNEAWRAFDGQWTLNGSLADSAVSWVAPLPACVGGGVGWDGVGWGVRLGLCFVV